MLRIVSNIFFVITAVLFASPFIECQAIAIKGEYYATQHSDICGRGHCERLHRQRIVQTHVLTLPRSCRKEKCVNRAHQKLTELGCTNILALTHLQLIRARCSSAGIQELSASPRFASIQVDHAISISAVLKRSRLNESRLAHDWGNFKRAGQIDSFQDVVIKEYRTSSPQTIERSWKSTKTDRTYSETSLAEKLTRQVSQCFPKQGENTHVFVIDTGCRTTHEQLRGRATAYRAPGSKFESGEDDHGHGTHIAATIAGRDIGIAKMAKISCIKAMSRNNTGSSIDVLSAINHVISLRQISIKSGKLNQAYIISISLGVEATPTYTALDSAITKAATLGIMPIIAAGNSGADACTFTPARAPGAITVGALSNDKSVASFSNKGPCVDLVAPGEKIRSAYNIADQAYARSSGTSMAAPFVSGIAALILGERPQMSRDDLLQELQRNADRVSGIPVASFKCPPRGFWS